MAKTMGKNDGKSIAMGMADTDIYSSWRNPKNLEISLGEGFCGSRGDAAFSLCLG